MISTVVVAAAGRGTRMKHLSSDKPKHLIPVGDRPFLSFVLEDIQKAGFTDIIVVSGYFVDVMRDFLKVNFPLVRMVNQFEMLGEKKYGTACVVECVRETVGNKPFVFVSGDNLYSVQDFSRMNIDDDYHYITGFPHPQPHQYGVLISEGEFLTNILEKSEHPPTNLINAGLYTFRSEIFGAVAALQPSPRGEYELPEAVSQLAREHKVKTMRIDQWIDFGSPEDIPIVEAFLHKEGRI